MFNNMMNNIESRPKNFGPMRDASAHAKVTGPCGDTVEIWLRIDGGKIRKASFISDGCSHSKQCCSIAAKLTEGMLPDEAAQITQAQILDAIGSVPVDHQHCALLAANTIKQAIKNFKIKPITPSFGQRMKQFLSGGKK